MNRKFAVLIVVAVAALALAHAQPAPKKLSLDLYLNLEDVRDPQISPDGKQIVYVRRWVDQINDKWDSALWILNSDGTKNRFFSQGSSARWSPDSKRVAYLHEGKKAGAQIFVKNVDSGAVTQITQTKQLPSNITWSPDGKTIAFTMLVPKASDDWKIELPGKSSPKWTEPPRIIENMVYRLDRMGFLEGGFNHIFLVPSAGGSLVQLTSGDNDNGGGTGFGGRLSWTPDGQEILYSTFRKEDWEYPWRNGEVNASNVRTKTKRQLTNRNGPDQDPVVSPDGRWVAYTGYDWTDDSYIVSKVYVMGIDGSNPRMLTEGLDRSPYTSPYASPWALLQWAADSNGVYINVDDRGTSNLYFVPRSGEVRQVTRGNHVVTVSDISPAGLAVGTLTSPHKPSDLISFSVAKPEIRQLTRVNDDLLAGVELGDVEEIWFTSTDNFRVQGWIIKPPGFDSKKKYPFILNIHGGPHGMDDVGFNFGLQNHAAEGYVVLYSNPRGSTGYGSAFANAIKYSYPGKDYDDLMAGVDEVLKRGYVDPKNLFVYGCSGGGVLTAWIVGHTDRFAAASSNCAVTDWFSFVGTTDGVSFYWTFRKMPWDDPSDHLARSPLMYAANVKTPTLFMTGELDRNTPIAQAEQLYRALKMRGVPTAMIRFNDEWHGTTSKPSNFLRTHLYLRHWFQKHGHKVEDGPARP